MSRVCNKVVYSVSGGAMIEKWSKLISIESSFCRD